jgi:ketosteroid isomerase-like protein
MFYPAAFAQHLPRCSLTQRTPFMRKAKPTLTHNGHADETEAAFYEAMQLGDIDKLMACWADEDDIVCVHPGGPRLVGALAIRSGFEAMFSHGTIRAHIEHVRRVQTLSVSIHSVLERVEVLTANGPAQAYVIATNVYLKTAQGWRLVAHHASPGTAQEVPQSDSPTVLH